MLAWRIGLAVTGILLGLFGVFRLVTEVPVGNLVVLAVWMVGAVVVHDGILSPLVVAVGVVVGRVVPPRARGYLQGALVAGGLVTVVAVPLILRAGNEPDSKALLRQNFGGNLTILLGVIAASSLLLYAVRVAGITRTRRRPSAPPTAPRDAPPGPGRPPTP